MDLGSQYKETPGNRQGIFVTCVGLQGILHGDLVYLRRVAQLCSLIRSLFDKLK